MKAYGFRVAVLMAGFFALGGCTITQKVDPVKMGATLKPEICMIAKTSKVKRSFTEGYRAELQGKGFKVIQLPAASDPFDCPLSTQYTASWRWDLALYMAYAEIRVFENGHPIGQAIYDSRKGGGLLTKFIDADDKLRELVNELFPQGAPRPVQ